MKRRDFLRNMAVTPLIARSCVAGGSMLATIKSAYAANGKTLIIIFQRGGCDGLNTVVPYAEAEYYKLRPDIAIAPPGSGSGSALDIDGFFGFHPAMSGLNKIYQQGDLAILPTVHYDNANRSHFSSQDYIESGVPNRSLGDGWLNRYLSTAQQIGELQAISFSTLAKSLQGVNPVISVNSLSSLNDNFDSAQFNVLQTIYNQQSGKANQNRSLLHNHGSLALDRLSFLAQFSNSTYVEENGAVYPSSLYGQQLRDIAQLVKANVGLEVASVSTGGWDHHAKQGGAQGAHATKLADFSSGIEALYKDLGALMNDVTILTVSEFGRTALQNASKGTDHGNAACWFVIGKQVNGGVYGQWPGLSASQLYQGRYLAHTIDFTDVYAELLKSQAGKTINLSAILPGSQHQAIGFLS